MMITRKRLKAEDVRQITAQIVREQMSLAVSGYKCRTSMIVDVLLKAAVDGVSVESICGDLRAVTGSNALRAQLNRVLDVCDMRRHEVAMNAALVRCVPSVLPRHGCEMAIDTHDEPFYGKTPELRAYACRGQAQSGTTHFYRIASLYVLWRQVRLTLAVTYVLPEDSPARIVQRLVERLQHLGFRPRVLYLDKGFSTESVIAYLQARRIPAIIACTIRGQAGKGGTRALCRGRCAYTTSYTFKAGTTVRMAFYPSRPPDKTGRRRRKWLAYIVIGLDWSAHKVHRRYRRRFGIESSYRQLGTLRVPTASRNPALRFFLLAFALLLVNVWIALRVLASRLPGSGPVRLDLDRFRLARFSAFLRRAIERAYGTLDSIPILSPSPLKL